MININYKMRQQNDLLSVKTKFLIPVLFSKILALNLNYEFHDKNLFSKIVEVLLIFFPCKGVILDVSTSYVSKSFAW